MDGVLELLKAFAELARSSDAAAWVKVAAALVPVAAYLGARAHTKTSARTLRALLLPLVERIEALEDVAEQRDRQEGRKPSLLTLAHARRAHRRPIG